MFGIGLGELVVIAVAALVLTKPGELGALARKAGKLLASLRSARAELEGALRDGGLDGGATAEAGEPAGNASSAEGATQAERDSPAHRDAARPSAGSAPAGDD